MGDEIIRKLEQENSDIADQVRILYDAVLTDKPPVILECGIRTGRSSEAILSACTQYGGILESCDISDEFVRSHKRIKDAFPSWNPHRGSSVTFLGLFLNKGVKMIFVDTDHELETLAEELVWADGALGIGGKIFLHDTKMYGVSGAVMSFINRHTNYDYCEMGGKAGLGRLTKKA